MKNQSVFQTFKRTTSSIGSSIEETAGMFSDVIKLERVDIVRSKLMNDTTDYVVGNMENQRVAQGLKNDFNDLDPNMVAESADLLANFLKTHLKANLQ